MAELIPFQYRVRVAQKSVLARWAFYGAVALAIAGLGGAWAWNWQRKQAASLADLQAEYQTRSPVLNVAKEMKNKWNSLVERRGRIDQLRDDKTLLALLHHISTARNEYDCLEKVQIDARKSVSGEKDSYFVRLVGVTSTDEELAGLMKRLSTECSPQINVILESHKREPYFDGTVLRFHILCERPQG